MYTEVVNDVLAALDCARDGKDHPRLNKMMDRTLNELSKRSIKVTRPKDSRIIFKTLKFDPYPEKLTGGNYRGD